MFDSSAAEGGCKVDRIFSMWILMHHWVTSLLLEIVYGVDVIDPFETAQSNYNTPPAELSINSMFHKHLLSSRKAFPDTTTKNPISLGSKFP